MKRPSLGFILFGWFPSRRCPFRFRGGTACTPSFSVSLLLLLAESLAAAHTPFMWGVYLLERRRASSDHDDEGGAR